MLEFDTSSIIYAWDNYPPNQFPRLWEWLHDKIHSREIVFSNVVKEEIERNSPECWSWIKKDCDPLFLESTQKILDIALDLQKRLDMTFIMGKSSNGKGANANDLIIIATAFVHDIELITNEAKQPDLPKITAKYKIPAVCSLSEVEVACRDFREFLIGSEKIFG